jgi:hypothetical protein
VTKPTTTADSTQKIKPSSATELMSTAPIVGVRNDGQQRVEGQVEEHFPARLVDRLPRTYRPDADAYLEILDRALLDRQISATEADAPC